MATEILKVVAIGNSRGVRIPRRLIRRYGIEDELQLLETAEGLLLRPINSDKLSFEESFRQMAADSDAIAEVIALDGTIGDGLEDEDWSGLVPRYSGKRRKKAR